MKEKHQNIPKTNPGFEINNFLCQFPIKKKNSLNDVTNNRKYFQIYLITYLFIVQKEKLLETC